MGSNGDHDQKRIDTHTTTFCGIDAVENDPYTKDSTERFSGDSRAKQRESVNCKIPQKSSKKLKVISKLFIIGTQIIIIL